MAARAPRLLIATAVLAALCAPAAAAINAPVYVPQLPAFAGGECTTSAGSVIVSCANMRANTTGYTWGGPQTIPYGSGNTLGPGGAGLSNAVTISNSGGYPTLALSSGSSNNPANTNNWVLSNDYTGSLTLQGFADGGYTNGYANAFHITRSGYTPTMFFMDIPLSIQAVATASNSATTPDSTANSQNRLSHVANNTALAAWANTAFPVERDGFAAPGDGGRARYTWSSTACTAADGGSQITATAGGCWGIDWSSVDNKARPRLFGAKFDGSIANSAADTAAVQAAANTGMALGLDAPGLVAATWVPSTCIKLTKQGQEIFGAERFANGTTQLRILAYSQQLGTTGTTAVACPGIFNYTGGEPAPHFHDLGVSFQQPDTLTVASYFNYPAMISAIGQPRGKAERLGCYGASVCFDIRGNSGGWSFYDMQVNAYKTGADTTGTSGVYNTGMSAVSGIGWRIDGELDTIRVDVPHIFPFGGAFAATQNNQTRLVAQDSSEVIGFQIGRCDECYIDHLMSISGLGIYASNGVYGTNNNLPVLVGGSFGFLSNTDFDTVSGMVIDVGVWNVSNTTFNEAIAGGNPQALVVHYANVSADNCRFVLATNSSLPLVENSSAVVNGTLQISNSSFDTAGNDTTALQNDGVGMTIVTGSTFNRAYQNASNAPITYSNPVIYKKSGNMTAMGDRMTNGPGSSTGNFILAGDGRDDIAFNNFFGWGISLPSSSSVGGIYSPNN